MCFAFMLHLRNDNLKKLNKNQKRLILKATVEPDLFQSTVISKCHANLP